MYYVSCQIAYTECDKNSCKNSSGHKELAIKLNNRLIGCAHYGYTIDYTTK